MRSHVTVAVFDYGQSSGGQNEHDGRRHVKKVDAITARSTNIDDGPGDVVFFDFKRNGSLE